MIEGLLAILLNILAIALITFVVSNMAVSSVVSLLAQQFTRFEINSRKATLWLLVLLPWIAVLCVIACFLYRLAAYDFSGKINEFAHWHHITSFNMMSWHSVTLILAFLIFAKIVTKQCTELVKHRRELSLLTSFATALGNDVYRLEMSQPSAFTGGFIHRACYVSTGILANTNVQEQKVIFAHEKAHADYYDPLKKWLFSLFCAFFIPAIAIRLKLHMTLAMEQAADKAVIEQNIPATVVASTLVKVAKLNHKLGRNSPVNSELVVNFGADILEQRVYFLLDQLELKPASRIVTLAFILLTFILSLLSIDGVHHLMETVFSH